MQASIKSPTNPLLPPASNALWVSDNWNNSLGAAPQFAYKLQNVTPGEQHDAVGVEGEEGYIAAYEDPETVIDLKYENVSMTDDQWHNWGTNVDDEAYILQ